MSRNRLVRWVALAGCSALIGALSFTPGASAHIGSSHAPYTTDGPDPRTATITSGNSARVCFDEQVVDGNPDAFEAKGYDSNISADAESPLAIDITNPSCVLADFEHPNLDQATVVVLDDCAVGDQFGNCSLPGALTLGGSTFNVREAPVPGNTDAPEHISTTPLPQTDQIEYGMDEEMDEDVLSPACTAGFFGYHEQDGDFVQGFSCDDVDGSTVTIGFNTDIQSGNVVRPFVTTNSPDCGTNNDPAAYDLGTDEVFSINDEAKYVTASGGLGNNTNDPDLMSVARQGNNQLLFTFDSSNITDEDENCFWAHSEDGSIYVADSVSRSGAVVTASFDNVAAAFQQIVRAGVSRGAVDQVGGDPNTYGSAALSASGSEASASEIPASQKPGYSDGPDLEQAVTNGANNTINYCHDEPVDSDPIEADAGDFFFTTSDSEDTNFGSTVLSINGACALVQFGGADDVDTAVAAGEWQNTITVQDRLGECDVVNEWNTAAFETCDSLTGDDDEGANRNIAGASVAVNGPPPSALAPPPGPPAPPGPPGPPGPGADCPPPYIVKKGNANDNKLKGGPLCDRLVGKGGDDVLRGKGEDDKLKGGPGDDVLKGGPGNDICKGGPGRDRKVNC